MKNSQAFPHLLGSDLLTDLSEDQKRGYLDGCALRRPAPGHEILTQGELSPGIFLVAQGLVEVSFCDPDGNQSIVNVAGPGEVLGDVEAIAGKPCAATCTALPETAVLLCPTPMVFAHLQSAVFVRNLSAIYYRRLNHDNLSKSLSQFSSVDQRLCMHLHQLTTERRPEIRVNQATLAAIIGCSRQTMNRKLGELREASVIRLWKGGITVLNREALCRGIGDEGFRS